MATVKKKKKSNFVDQVVKGEYQSIFSKNNAGTGSNTVSLLGDDSPFLSTQKKSSFADQVVNGTYDSFINTIPKSSKGEKKTTTLSSSVGNVNKEGYKSTGKKYGDYKYQGYKERKDYEIYEKEGKYYYYDAKRKSYIPMDQAELTTPELDKKSYEEAKKQGYKGSKDTLKIADRIKLDTANLTEKEYKDYKKDLERQQEDKEEAEKRKNRVRVSGTGLKGSLGELDTLFSNAGANIDDNIIEPVRDVKDNYKVGKMTEQLGLEAYKKMTGEKNDYDKIRKEYDKYVTFNEDIINDVNYLDQAIQTIPNQVGGLIAGVKGGGIGGIAGAILGGGVGAVATRTPQGALAGAEKGAKFLGQAGYVGGQSQYTYKIEAGLQYQTLIDMGVPEDIAKKEAKDTGLFNALVEGGESILDLVSFGGISKVKGALTKKLVEKYGEETVTSWARKTALQNLVTEGLEEGIQEGGSIHNEKQALEQARIKRDDSKDWERIKESIIAGGLAGFLLGGGVSAVTGTAKVGAKAINEKAIKSNVDQQINAYEKETGIKLTTDEKKELLNETLNRAKEIQNTQKEPVSQQEKELQKQQFVYEAKDTDSEARIKLAQTTDVLNNSKAHHELFELTSKIAEDTGISIKFVNDSKQEMVEEKQRFTQKYAKSNGITLEEANSKLKDLTIDGFVNDKGELIINADSPKALNVILGHETTHLFENTKEYAPLQKALFELAETRGDMKKLREDMTRLYEGTNANIDNEITSELAGEYLFTDQDFINRLSAEQPSTFKKIYDYLKHLYKTVTAQNKEARQLEQVMYRYEKAYKEFSKTTTQQSKTNLTTEADNNRAKELSGTKYSLSDNQGRTLSKEQQEYFKDSKVRDEEGNLKVMYHGTEAMAGLPEEAWFTIFDTKRAGSNGSFFGTGFYFTDSKEHAQDYAHSKGKVYETYLNIKNPYIPYQNLEDSVSRTFKEDLVVRLNINKEASSLTGKEITEILKENGYDGVINGDTVVAFYPEQIKNVDNTTPTNNLDIRYSLSVSEANTTKDNEDRKLTKWQKEYFKDSKVVDENGNLITVYHTMTNKGIQFNEFNPVGTDYYKFGDQVVNYYTDSKNMSGSYAQQDYEMADTSKLNNLSEAYDYVEKIKNTPNTIFSNDVMQTLNLEENNGKYALKFNGNTMVTYDSETDVLKKIKVDLDNRYGKQNKYQYEGYINITNPYVVDAEGRSWGKAEIKLNDNKQDDLNKITSDLNKVEQLKSLMYKSRNLNSEYNLSGDEWTYYHYKNTADALKGIELNEAVQYCAMFGFEYNDYAKMYENLPSGDSTVTDLTTDLTDTNYNMFKNMTLSDFVRVYAQEYKKNMLYGKEDSYFNHEYKNITGELKELTASDLFNIATKRFTVDSITDTILEYSSTNNVVKKVIDMNKNGSKYDGVIFKNVYDYGGYSGENELTPNDVYVTFNSNQFKAVDNTKPTSDADIRYSLSEKGTLVDDKGNDVTLEASDTGNTNTLMAIHNLSASKLKGILELGGFPVPSIAVMNPGTTNLSYGEISVLFDKSTIDPSNKANEVYGSDVYSPRFPQTVQKVNEKELSKLENYLGKSLYLEDTTLDETVQKNIYTKEFIDKFAKENNITVENVYKDSGFNYTFSTYEDVKKFIIENDITFEKLLNNKQLRNEFYDLYRQSTPETLKGFTERRIEIFEKAFDDNNANIGNRLDSDFNYIKNGSEKVLDEYATEKALRDKVLGQYEEQYTKFLTEKLTPVFENKYIRNNKELFTPKGNRRNFNQLYNEYTLDNVVKEMKGKVRGEEGFFYGAGNIRSQVTPQFKSIADIKANEGKLVTNAQMEEIKEDIDSDLNNLSATAYNFGGYFYDSYETALNEIAGLKKITPAKAKEILSDYGFEDVPDILVDKSIEFLEKLKNAPTEYFEAKPQRAVGLDEVQAIVIPNDTDTDLKQQLSDRGLYVVEYDPNIEGDRQNKINQFDDLKFSLSNQREEIAPIGNGKRIYGNKALGVDIAPLEQKIDELSQKISDLQENIAPVSQDIVERENMNNFNTLTDDDAPTNLSDEETRELNRLNSLPFDLEGEEQSRVDELTRKQDEYGSFTFDNETPEVKNKSVIIKDLKGFGMSQQEARNLYNKIANDSTTTPEDIFEELKNYRDIYEESDYYKQIRNDIKGTRLNISNIKDQIKDYGNSYRMSLMGKRLILGNSGQPIDTFYQELSNNYPDVFSPEITAEADQLDAIVDFLYRDDKMLVDRLSDGEITELANKIYNEIDTTERLNNTRETLYSNSNFKNLVSLLEAGEITPETYEDFLKSLPKELSTKYEPYLEFARELNASSTDKTRQKDRIRSLLDEKSIKVQETTNEPTISSNNPFNELLDKFLKRKKTKPDVAPKVEKSKVRNLVDTTKELFVNRNTEIDNLAKESGNLNIKYAGDMLNSVAGEVEGDIYTAQTDNYGHEIGKSVSGLFQEAKNKGLYDAFNDYLEQYSNIDRHSRGKGSQTPLAVSQKLVQDYEKSYPGFKKMAEDVWKYSSNIRDNMVESGLITQEFSDTLAEMYPHYVPFMENREMTNVYQDIGEAKPKGVIKYAKGGAKNLLPVEEALTKYTYASKKAIRQNQLYQQIVNTLNDKVEIGADVRSDPTELDTSLYRDEKGNYLTAYVNGKQESVRISDDLYRGLKNDMESRLKDLEQRLSLITKPLQKVSEVRRNLLTTWSPTFIITNPVKDIQDAVFNSKYTKDMLKNYPTSFMELSMAKNETAKQFLALYGSGNTQGDYSIDSGLNKGIAKKNTKFLKGISKLNNIVELAPRYAEFKASLENGATVPEAMYNAREITTNFNRGGTITKALNRNGATFLNTSVQGFDKFVRNFSGENGAKGVASALLKASLFGVLPGVFNELVFGGDDDDKDEDYEALPDYIKDNYYLIKTGDGNFIRIPKGRMLSVFGSASRRTIEYLNGEDDAFEGFLKNAYTQVGFDDPAESNIFTPIKQAIDNKAWYGGDLVPSRLQKLAPKEQYDASTDKFSIWLGDKLNISPYKINYVLEQYTGGLGDMVLPLITEEAQSDSDSIPEMMLSPIRDKFTSNSTSDNKYASDIYNLSDKMDKATSDIKETDEYKIQDIYLYEITSQMAELYQERRDVQADTSLSKSEKYKKAQSIQEQINSLAKEGLDNYKNVQKTDNYAIVGGREFNKYTTDDGKERWGKPREDELNDLNSMGMTLYEKSSYFKAKTDISSIKDEYKDSEDYVGQKRDIIDVIKNTYLNDEQKSYLYDRYYGNTETLGIINAIGIDFDSYLDYEYQNFTSDKDENGKTISGSKKQKVFDYINSMDIDFEQKLILAKLQYKNYDEYNYDIVDYLNNNDDISYEDEITILKKLGFTVDDEGNIYW